MGSKPIENKSSQVICVLLSRNTICTIEAPKKLGLDVDCHGLCVYCCRVEQAPSIQLVRDKDLEPVQERNT
jgi:hypothetical protein